MVQLSWKDRLFLKLAGRKVRSMDGLKRWLPFISTVIAVICAFLKAMGYAEQADLILRVVAFILPVADGPDAALATTAAVSAVGLVTQLVSRFRKAREQADSITIPVR